MWSAIGGGIALLTMIWIWWVKNTDVKKTNKEKDKKRISDDVASGDVGRINADIMRLRK